MDPKTIKDRVEYLIKTYKTDFDRFWKPYVDKCEERVETPIDLTEAKHYADVEFIGLSVLEELTKKHVKQFMPAEKRAKTFIDELRAKEADHAQSVCLHLYDMNT